MDWIQFTIFVLGNMVFTLTLWLWNRTEARTDNRHMENKLDANRELIIAIHDEMKDFHYRLLEIERSRK